jgi:hypothetical protein
MRIIVANDMSNWQWLLDAGVAGLLVATLWRAYRLELALASLRRDRGALEALTTTFDVSTRQAQGGIDRLRELADSAGRRVEQQSATALGLKDDLALLIERGERLAERMDHATRAARTMLPARPVVPEPPRRAPPRTEALREPVRESLRESLGEPVRVRSQAERDLLMALQANR